MRDFSNGLLCPCCISSSLRVRCGGTEPEEEKTNGTGRVVTHGNCRFACYPISVYASVYPWRTGASKRELTGCEAPIVGKDSMRSETGTRDKLAKDVHFAHLAERVCVTGLSHVLATNPEMWSVGRHKICLSHG